MGQRHAIRRLTKMFAYADLPPERRLVSYFWWSTPELRSPLFSAAVRSQLGSADVGESLEATLSRLPAGTAPLNQMLALETRHFLADHNLNYTDKAGMASGIEVRVPLLDLDLVAFAARVPVGWKQRGRTGKALFKLAMEPLLPREIIYRPKTGFGAPLRSWMRGPLQSRLDDVLGPAALRARGLFDPEAVSRLRRLDADGRVDGAYTLFALACVEIWCRRFLDTPAAHQSLPAA